MKRRNLLGVLGVTAAGMAAFRGRESKAGERDQSQDDCLKACLDCTRICDETFHHCYKLVMDGSRGHGKALELSSDCAAFCGLSASMIARHSSLMAFSCTSCAAACAACAAECDKFDMPEMKACAAACRDCERTCRAMVRNMSSPLPPRS